MNRILFALAIIFYLPVPLTVIKGSCKEIPTHQQPQAPYIPNIQKQTKEVLTPSQQEDKQNFSPTLHKIENARQFHYDDPTNIDGNKSIQHQTTVTDVNDNNSAHTSNEDEEEDEDEDDTAVTDVNDNNSANTSNEDEEEDEDEDDTAVTDVNDNNSAHTSNEDEEEDEDEDDTAVTDVNDNNSAHTSNEDEGEEELEFTIAPSPVFLPHPPVSDENSTLLDGNDLSVDRGNYCSLLFSFVFVFLTFVV
ncbi:hypothetical protein DPX39_000057300 [Trypanosoma brucei equiperdum]|uniref:Uncharacterized protein n=1 Tax=Trypanosoma brucei equiperdum TaxID=630700 RepID=A0A3L6KTJ6_9TRYP|nr:hypothetical protein DPX39_000057300 [Trypanosoma brucei equiperdum]